MRSQLLLLHLQLEKYSYGTFGFKYARKVRVKAEPNGPILNNTTIVQWPFFMTISEIVPTEVENGKKKLQYNRISSIATTFV
jgi:hypothetical protein